MVVKDSQSDLLEIIAALNASRRLPGPLNNRKQQGDENRDDGDYHQQFDQRKRVATALAIGLSHESISPFHAMGLGRAERH